MIHSMTGFGRATAEVDNLSATVELKSVNNRFCEVSIRAPRYLFDRENEIQNRLKKVFARGRISVQIQIDRKSTEQPEITLNKTAVKYYARLFKDLKKVAGASDRVQLNHLLRFEDDIFLKSTKARDRDVTWSVVKAALDAAIEGLQDMRKHEGRALETDLLTGVTRIAAYCDDVKRLAPERVAAAREKLQQRITDMIGAERVNEERLEQEIAMLSDKLDVNEESVRLDSHLVLFRDALKNSDPVGRKLNFIVQEMNREINTIGSKSNDSSLTEVVVAMKEELERIREQVENVE
ncbi:MAG: YicC family protein [Rhodothermales bacterium]|nr:YicC family protein [Rhodothermales bacterium]